MNGPEVTGEGMNLEEVGEVGMGKMDCRQGKGAHERALNSEGSRAGSRRPVTGSPAALESLLAKHPLAACHHLPVPSSATAAWPCAELRATPIHHSLQGSPTLAGPFPAQKKQEVLHPG